MKFILFLLFLIAAAYYVISNEMTSDEHCYLKSELLNTVTLEQKTLNPDLQSKPWPANWICHPHGPYRDYGVFFFRKILTLDKKPDSYIIHLTADNRYAFFINGTKVCAGPAKSALGNWEFDTIDIAPFLQAGQNAICATVWNYGIHASVWQLSSQLGLIIQGNGEAEQGINTDKSWKSLHCTGYAPVAYRWDDFPGFFAIHAGDDIDANLIPWNWREAAFDDSNWSEARLMGYGNMPQLAYWNATPWLLKSRTIPLIPEGPIIRHKKIIREQGTQIPTDFLAGTAPLKIEAKKQVSLLCDLEEMTTAYPEIIVKGGKNAEIKVAYSECLWKVSEVEDEKKKEPKKIYEKGHRNDFQDKIILGPYDRFVLDGGHRLLSPLYWRTWRFMQLDIQTADDPLLLCDIRSRYTAYPYALKATFESRDASLQKIWTTGWRTTCLCANDLFLDTPYYEQLNYAADARIQSLMAYTHTNDDRLAKRSIQALSQSIVAAGLTQDRFPSHIPQFIPSWSLDWIQLFYDFWMYRDDPAFVQQNLPLMRVVLDWFEKRLDPSTGILKDLAWDNHAQAVAPWNTPKERMTMEFYLALLAASKMESKLGSSYLSKHYQQLARQMQKALIPHYWDEDKGEWVGQSEEPNLARVIHSLLVLCDILPIEQQQALMQLTLLYPYEGGVDDFFANYYWLFFMHEALLKCGMGNQYLDVLTPWHDMLAEGLTTWAESFPPSRSDCHGWSCSPNIHFLTLVCGIRPIEPSFKKVRIAPHMGQLQELKASMPHPMGSIDLELKRKEKGGVGGWVTLPPSLSGEFIWGSSKVELHPGKQQITFFQ